MDQEFRNYVTQTLRKKIAEDNVLQQKIAEDMIQRLVDLTEKVLEEARGYKP